MTAKIDTDFLKTLTETPSVGTACGPAVSLLTERFGSGWTRTLLPDGCCIFTKSDASPDALKAVFVAHMDEVGGCIYGARHENEGGGFMARHWGNTPDIFANAMLQGFDYLAQNATDAYPVTAKVEEVDGEDRLIVYGENIRHYRTVWTFKEETTFSGDIIEGKALDPRVTLYSVIEAVLALDDPAVGAMIVMAEECAMDVARKGVVWLQRNAPNLQLIVNADVPGIQNIGDGRLDLPAIRIFEGRNFIDPSFGIRVSEVMERQGVAHHLSAARSGSQTLLFTPLAPTLSIALPSEGVHLPCVRMSLTGTERCTALLTAIGASSLRGELDFA